MSKTVVITGASRGIGRATARELIEHDPEVTTVVLVARDENDLADARTELTALGHDVAVETIAADLSDHSAVMELIDRLATGFDSIDVLVNNAGYTNPVSLQLIDFEDMQKTMMVNLYAPFLLTQELLRRGNRFQAILNVASTAGINGRAGWLTYSASKAALINMSEVMRQELAVYGTRVVCISPGRCATDLRRTLAPDEDPTTIMQPEHVARVIRDLLSDTGRYLDSGNLVVRK